MKNWLFAFFLVLATSSLAQTNWFLQTGSTEFDPRDSSPNASVIHQGAIYVLAGYRHIGSNQWESLSDTWKSMDGTKWELLNATPPYEPYCSFVSFNGKIWAFGEQSYASDDGINWSVVHTSLTIPFSSRAIVHNNEVFISFGKTIIASEDGINFRLITESAPWTPRYWPAFVSFKSKLWFFGGGIRYRTGTDFYYSDVWSSSNGLNWTQETPKSNWPGRYWFSYIVFDQKIWAFAGWDYFEGTNGEYGNLNDSWFTSDGINWTQINTETKIPNRHASLSWCKDGYVWLSSGYGGGGVSRMYNDVWKLIVENDYLDNIQLSEVQFGDTLDLPTQSTAGLPIHYELSSSLAELSNFKIVAKGVGEFELSATQNGNCDYAYSEKKISIRVEKREVLADVNDENIFFGDPIPKFEIAYRGFAFNHTEDSIQTLPRVKIDSLASLSLGEHLVSLIGGEDSRYNFMNQSGVLRVYSSDYNSYVFPNPASTEITPVLSIGEITGVYIYDNRSVLVASCVPNSNGSVSIESLAPGLYQVKITSGNRSFWTKLIKG